VTYSQTVGHRKRLLAAPLFAAIAIAAAVPGPSLAAGSTGPGVYDPSSPAGDQYADPFERGRSAGGGDVAPAGGGAAGGGGNHASAPAVAATAPPALQASAVPAFGAGVTRRVAAGSPAAGSAAPSHAQVERAATDRVLAAREVGSVESSATGDLLLIGGVSAALVLGAALLAYLRRRSVP
jgi:hypothetical protein